MVALCPGTDFVIFKIFSPKKLQKNGRFWLITKLNYAKKTLVFRKRQFFRRKLAKIAENCDHNIDPRIWGLKFIRNFFRPKWSFVKLIPADHVSKAAAEPHESLHQTHDAHSNEQAQGSTWNCNALPTHLCMFLCERSLHYNNTTKMLN
jgi:hypothetical protein